MKIIFISLLGFFILMNFTACDKDNTTDPNNNGNSNNGNNNNGTNPTAGVFQTYSFDAQIGGSNIPKAEVGSFMDNDKNTHIAWIKDEGNTRSLMYTYFDCNNQTFSSQIVYQGAFDELVAAPDIVTDNNGNIHIAFFIKRDVNVGTSDGNYAVMYSSNNTGTWNTSQVSTNPTDPTVNSNDLYNAYVNGRPQVFIQNSVVKVGYQADANTNTAWDKYYILATNFGSNWTREQAFNLDNLTGTFSASDAMSLAPVCSGDLYAGFIEISNYSVRFLSESTLWSETEVGNYAATFGNKHVQIMEDVLGDTYFFWYNKSNDKFCRTILSGSTYSSVSEFSPNNSPSGNFFPATVDQTLDQSVMFYNVISGDGYLIKYDDQSQGYTEIFLDDADIGVVYGKDCLYSNGDYISLVTASATDAKIYLTTNNSF